LKLFLPARRLRGIQKSGIRQIFDRAQPGSINFGLGEPDVPTPGLIREAAIRVITDEQNGYTLQAGLPALRELVANYYPDCHLSPEEVIITAGSQEGLYLALMTLVDEGDEVLLPNPGFVAYPTIVRMAGGTPVYYDLPAARNFSFDAEAFRRALSPRTKVVVCISPSNPTGRVLSRADVEAIAGTLEGTGIYVVSDEIYRELYYTPDRPPSISSCYDRTIVVSGLSKAMSMTGWRLGWLCGPTEVIKPALVLHGYVTTCASTISQKAALTAWSSKADQARAEIREIFRERKDCLIALVTNELKRKVITPDGAFYSMVDVSDDGPSLKVAEALLEYGVITIPGAAFGSQSEGFLRVSFCADLPALEEGIRRMKSGLESLHNANGKN
jgi:aspartate/methionine/tyrosine aminotransferase